MIKKIIPPLSLWLSLWLSSAVLLSMVSRADELVVASSNKGAQRFNADEVRQIFLGDKQFWDDGSRIIVIISRSASNRSPRFFSEILKMSERQFDQHWKAKLFSGLGYPPRSFSSDKEAADFLRTHPEALGLVPPSVSKDLTILFSERRPQSSLLAKEFDASF